MSGDATSSTPLRLLPHSVVDGVRVLRETGATWLDGSEGVLFDRMREGDLPLDSLSDELFATAESWPERYHLSPSRANVLRALDLPTEATVLEVGAGCGAITRYLGETCAHVDALEPTFARARVAAERTRDLPGVAVVNGEVVDLPAESAYDLVVVVGVLEYVGGGGADDAPYVDFLQRLRGALRPGGRLVLAIENPLGVKYLAGAPEDHSNQVFHSVEGYPVDGPARTFSRRKLAGLAHAAGFEQTDVLGAFPDYKLTRAVLSDGLYEHAPGLADNLPAFPSPDWTTPRPVLLDEQALWGELVAAGVGPEFANSLLLIAGTGGDPAPLWPEGRLARYFSLHRRRAFQVRKTVHRQADAIQITSELLGSGSQDGLTVLPYSEPYAAGASSLAELALADPERLDELVMAWVELLRTRAVDAAPETPFDVVPGNVLHRDGDTWIVDDEWRAADVTLDEVVLRGALILARDLLEVAPADRWGCMDGDALVSHIAQVAGLDPLTPDDVAAAVEREALLQARVGGGAPGSPAHARARAEVEREMRRQLAEPVSGVREERLWDAADRLQREAIEARDLLLPTGEQLEEARAEIVALRADLERVRDDLTRVLETPGVRSSLTIARKLGRSPGVPEMPAER